MKDGGLAESVCLFFLYLLEDIAKDRFGTLTNPRVELQIQTTFQGSFKGWHFINNFKNPSY